MTAEQATLLLTRLFGSAGAATRKAATGEGQQERKGVAAACSCVALVLVVKVRDLERERVHGPRL